MTMLQLIIRSLKLKRLGYIYATNAEALAAFNLYAYQIKQLCPNNRIEIDYINRIVKNNTCRTEEHYLCAEQFVESEIDFFRCLSYHEISCDDVKQKYAAINSY